MFLSYFDILIIVVLVFLNVFLWKKKTVIFKRFSDYLAGLILFAFALPLISIILEFKVFNPKSNEVFDSFTMLYTFLKFPIYWIIIVLQIIFFRIKVFRDKRINLPTTTVTIAQPLSKLKFKNKY